MKRWVFLTLTLTALLLAACAPAATPTPDTDAAIQAGPLVISATGEVLPAREATLSFQTSGVVYNVTVEIGDEVQEGDVIAQVDSAILEAELVRAEAAVAVVQANLEQSLVGARAEQLDEAEANLSAAYAQTNVAQAQLDLLSQGPTDAQVAAAEARVQQAFINQHNARLGTTGEKVDAGAWQRYDSAKLAYEEAVAALDQLIAGTDPDDLDAAQNEVWSAAANAYASQANLDRVAAGTREEQIAVVEAQLEAARASLDRAVIALDQATLRAPFSGVIAEVLIRTNEYANVGVPVFTLADLSTMRVETTDLNEIDVASLQEGAAATVTFDALPGVEVAGVIESISPRAEDGTGVNFTVIVSLSELPEGLRWGMTAFVDFPLDD